MIVQRPWLWDVCQVLPEDAFGHRAKFDFLSDSLHSLPFLKVTGQLLGQFSLKFCLTWISAFWRLKVIFMDVKRLQVDSVGRKLLGNVAVVVFFLGVVVQDLPEAVVDLSVAVVQKPVPIDSWVKCSNF